MLVDVIVVLLSAGLQYGRGVKYINPQFRGGNMSELIALRGGLTVPREAFDLFHALVTHRGLVLTQDDDKLRVARADGSRPDLTPEDAALIRRWKPHLLALLAYRAPEEESPL